MNPIRVISSVGRLRNSHVAHQDLGEMIDHGFDRAGWAARIGASWGAVFDSVIATGRALIEAKAALPHGEFMAMVKGDLPFSHDTANKLMKIARDGRIANSEHVLNLPKSWGTLYELTKLGDQAFDQAIAAGAIRPDMERGEATRLRTGERRVARLARMDRMARAETAKRGVAAPAPLEAVARRKCYGVIYADPPWHHRTWSELGEQKSPGQHYPTMSRDELLRLPVGQLAAPKAALWLWSTIPHLAEALELLAAWGFVYRSEVVWHKTYPNGSDRLGTGFWFRDTHEILLLATKGDPPAPVMGTQSPSLVTAPVGRHSEKPAQFRELIERYFPVEEKIELFARTAPAGWDVWGNEVPGHGPCVGDRWDSARDELEKSRSSGEVCPQ